MKRSPDRQYPPFFFPVLAIVILFAGVRLVQALKTQQVEVGEGGTYDATVFVGRDPSGNLTFQDQQEVTPVLLTDLANVSLAEVAGDSTTVPNSTYTLSPAVDVRFEDSSNNEVLSIREGSVRTAARVVRAPSAAQPITAVGDSIPVGSVRTSLIILDPDADYVLTSTPTIANGFTGDTLILMTANGEANTVTIQDESALGGSNVQLDGGVNRVIGDLKVLELIFNGSFWVERNYGDN